MSTAPLNTICRLCGSRSVRLMLIDLQLANHINFLFHLQLLTTNDEDKLSKRICSDCLSIVNNSWTFYEQVHKVQHELMQRYCLKEEPANNDEDDLKMQSSDDEVLKPRETARNKILKKLGKRIKVKRKNKAAHTVINNDEFKDNNTDCTSNEDKDSKTKDAGESWPDYPWGCNICGNKFADEQFYKKHPCYKTHNRFFCADCPKSFKLYNRIISHIKESHWDRLQAHLLLQCDLCKIWFRSKKDQAFHREQLHPEAELRIEPEMPAHMSKERFKCLECGKKFANKNSLKQHEPLHSEEKKYVCNLCGERFRQAPGLDYHTKKFHTEAAQQFHCDQCGKRFPIKQNLDAHMITHTSERPFVCEICQKAFKTQFSVDLHRTRHAVIRKHVCKTCGKSFKNHRDLQAHMYRHALDKTHKCSFCEKAFKTRANLTCHERQHTGEQPYSCLVCQRKFTSVGNRLKHMRRIHKICLRGIDTENNEEQLQENVAETGEESSFCKSKYD